MAKKQKTWNYHLPKKRKKYAKGGRTKKAREYTQKQIDILKMMDTEYLSEVYFDPRAQNPYAKMGMDYGDDLIRVHNLDPDSPYYRDYGGQYQPAAGKGYEQYKHTEARKDYMPEEMNLLKELYQKVPTTEGKDYIFVDPYKERGIETGKIIDDQGGSRDLEWKNVPKSKDSLKNTIIHEFMHKGFVDWNKLVEGNKKLKKRIKKLFPDISKRAGLFGREEDRGSTMNQVINRALLGVLNKPQHIYIYGKTDFDREFKPDQEDPARTVETTMPPSTWLGPSNYTYQQRTVPDNERYEVMRIIDEFVTPLVEDRYPSLKKPKKKVYKEKPYVSRKYEGRIPVKKGSWNY